MGFLKPSRSSNVCDSEMPEPYVAYKLMLSKQNSRLPVTIDLKGINWIYEMATKLKQSQSTAHLGVFYFKRFLTTPIDPHIKLKALACLFLASKLDDVYE